MVTFPKLWKLISYCSFQDLSSEIEYSELMEEISWFFVHLIMLGYVEDPKTGLSFRLPGGLRWKLFIEVLKQ